MNNETPKIYDWQTLGAIAKDMGIGYGLLLSYIAIHPNLTEVIDKYRNKENPLKNKKVLPPNVVKEIYATLGY